MSNHAQGFESTQTSSGEYLFEVQNSTFIHAGKMR
jgi:hypothetical protein